MSETFSSRSTRTICGRYPPLQQDVVPEFSLGAGGLWLHREASPRFQPGTSSSWELVPSWPLRSAGLRESRLKRRGRQRRPARLAKTQQGAAAPVAEASSSLLGRPERERDEAEAETERRRDERGCARSAATFRSVRLANWALQRTVRPRSLRSLWRPPLSAGTLGSRASMPCS